MLMAENPSTGPMPLADDTWHNRCRPVGRPGKLNLHCLLGSMTYLP